MIEDLVILASFSLLTFCYGIRAGRNSTRPLAPPPNWKTDPDADTAPEQHWELFLEQWNMAAGDDERLDVLRFWLESDNTFTYWEETEILGMVETAEMREKIRAMLLAKMKEDDAAEEQTDA